MITGLGMPFHPFTMIGRDAVDDSRRIFEGYKPLIPYCEHRPTDPLIGEWLEWRDKAVDEAADG